ncbi:DUF523 domain-containing protein [Sebaldella sp. S0638]|uniref:DUF523 domain-containing protein n=1 Tax=Sebaldella sp. S0638 TaxID=2957809 RepID=UPI00209F10E1|nr:DUF523 domain-containing protein [Sebaldella sp. S0638]MCP1224956.1 DUF523 domain-containing protein [Sebaldella sp. S0638]
MKYLISACLVGKKCNYKGESNVVKKLRELYLKGDAVLVCPEVMGGLKTPREAAEILTYQEKLTIKTISGKDVTEAFIIGAGKALKVAKENRITTAILKARSPSCGCSQIYDGTFSKKIVDGDGVTASLLKLNGIKVITEEEILQKLKKLSDDKE